MNQIQLKAANNKYRIVPISPSDGTTKVERCEGVNVNCEAGEA